MTDKLSPEDRMMLDGLYWWDIPTLFRCPLERDPSKVDIALVGVPHSTGNGTTERDQHLGPRAVRDVPLPEANDNERCIERITEFYKALDAAGVRPVSVGGDHSITGGIMQAIAGDGATLTGGKFGSGCSGFSS